MRSGADNGTDMVCSSVVSRLLLGMGCHRGGPARDWLRCIVAERHPRNQCRCEQCKAGILLGLVILNQGAHMEVF